MADSGAVAGRLWDVWLPHNVKMLVSEALPGGIEDGRKLAVWLTASHDIGKATPASHARWNPWRTQCGTSGWRCRTRSSSVRTGNWVLTGSPDNSCSTWLTERHGWAERSSRQFAIVIGGHHGVHPGPQRIHDLDLHPELLRTKGPSEATWKTVQFELLDACARAAGTTDRLDAWRDVKLPQCAQVTLTARVILADWIASSAELFPYVTRHEAGSNGTGRQTTRRTGWRPPGRDWTCPHPGNRTNPTAPHRNCSHAASTCRTAPRSAPYRKRPCASPARWTPRAG
jgi:CRISPR-associated endonuclease Cas3-HD